MNTSISLSSSMPELVPFIEVRELVKTALSTKQSGVRTAKPIDSKNKTLLSEDVLHKLFEYIGYVTVSKYSLSCKSNLEHFKIQHKNHQLCASVYKRALQKGQSCIDDMKKGFKCSSPREVSKLFNEMIKIQPQNTLKSIRSFFSECRYRLGFAALKGCLEENEQDVQSILLQAFEMALQMSQKEFNKDFAAIQKGCYIQSILSYPELEGDIINKIPEEMLNSMVLDDVFIDSKRNPFILQLIQKRFQSLSSTCSRKTIGSLEKIKRGMCVNYFFSGHLKHALEIVFNNFSGPVDLDQINLEHLVCIAKKLKTSEEKDFAQKITHFVRKRLCDQNLPNNFKIAQIYAYLGDLTRAESIIKSITDKDLMIDVYSYIELAEVVLILAKAYKKNGNTDLSVSCLDEAIERCKQHEAFNHSLGGLLVRLECVKLYFEMDFKDRALELLNDFNSRVKKYIPNDLVFNMWSTLKPSKLAFQLKRILINIAIYPSFDEKALFQLFEVVSFATSEQKALSMFKLARLLQK